MMLLIQPQHIKYLLCTILLAYNTDAIAQLHHQMVSTQGGLNSTSSGIIVSQTVGQVSVTGNYSNNSSKVGQGFQQSSLGQLLITGLNPEISTNIYPNPFKNHVTISYSLKEMVTVTLFDMAGKLIYKNKLSFLSGVTTIDVSFLKSGFYLIRLDSKLNTYYTKIVKRWST